MKTNVNSARADFLSKYKANLNEIKKCDNVINFNEYYIDPKDRLSRDEVRDVVTEMSRDMERKERTKRPNSKKRKLRHNKNSRENKKIKSNIEGILRKKF